MTPAASPAHRIMRALAFLAVLTISSCAGDRADKTGSLSPPDERTSEEKVMLLLDVLNFASSAEFVGEIRFG
jgi:hypothetical protein